MSTPLESAAAEAVNDAAQHAAPVGAPEREQVSAAASSTQLLDALLGGDGASSQQRLVSFTIETANADVASVICFDRAPALLPASEWFPGRPWRPGQQCQGLVVATDPLTVSVVRPRQIELMLAGLVPEVRSGVVQIMGVARLAGVRTKVAVASADAAVDAVAACVGRKASRVRHLVEQLGGERIDVIAWSPDPQKLLSAALAPAQVDEIVFSGRRAEVKVPAHRMAATVGGGGLNSQLAGQLSGYSVQVVPA